MDGRSESFSVSALAKSFSDPITCLVRFDHLKFCLLPMEDYEFPRNLKCRCNTDRCNDNHCRLPMCVGNREWKRKSCRELVTVRVCCALHIPDLHGLPSFFRSCGSSCCICSLSAGLSTSTTRHNGFLLDTHAYPFNTAIRRSLELYVSSRCIANDYSFRHHLTGLSNLRVLCSN